MQAPGDNTISIVDPQTTYADNNLNEKTLSTQYIYTTEGQLIPATQEVVSASMNLNPQQPYVVTDSTYITEQQSIDNSIDQESADTVPSYGFAATQVQDSFVSTQPVQTTASYVANFDANSEDSQQESIQSIPTSVDKHSEHVQEHKNFKEESVPVKVRDELKVEDAKESTQEHIQGCAEVTTEHLNEPVKESVQSIDEPVQSVDESTQSIEESIQDADEATEKDIEAGVICTEEPVQDTLQLEVESNIQPSVESNIQPSVESNIQPSVDSNIQLTVDSDLQQPVDPDIEPSVDPNIQLPMDISTESSINCRETSLNIEEDNADRSIDVLQNTTNETQEVSTARTELEQSVENIENVIESITDSTKDEEIIEGGEDKENDQVQSIQEENITELHGTNELEQITSTEEEMPSQEMHTVIETLTEHDQLTADIIDGSNQVEITVEDIQGDDDTQDDNESCDVQEETMVIVYEDSSSQEALSEDESYNENIIESQTKKPRTETQTRRPRGRRPKKEIPLHILGHDINKPVDTATNGKAPKPRLGVKVPYRNLTSQMVSRQDIEKEIMERGKKRQQKEHLFVRSLTARLAKKLSPSTASLSKQTKITGSTTEDSSSSNQNIAESAKGDSNINTTDEDEKQSTEPKEGIENNSDLLAILEGNDESEEIVLAKETTASKKNENTKSDRAPADETSIKNLEREIALQQLQDLPYLSPSNRFVKGKICKSYLKEIPNLSYTAEGKMSIAPSANQPTNQTKPPGIDLKPSKPLKQQVSEKKTLDVEPQIKVNIALKTYSRKRKSLDNPPEPLPAKKSPVPLSTAHIDLKSNIPPGSPTTDGVYVTKSSRIIKKKVIWDPAEAPIRTIVTKQISLKNDELGSPKSSARQTIHKSEIKVVERNEKKPENKIENEKKNKESDEKSPPKKTVLTTGVSDKKVSPPGNKLAQKHKKVRSEVDKLLGDEGTIKMLYDLKNDPAEEKRRKTTISVEKTFKDLAKKANQIKSDLVNNSSVESPKSLRKKEQGVSPVTTIKQSAPSPTLKAPSPIPVTVSRQKSKDSNRSTPPRSPPYTFPNETSYLIRRRSSSSISSTGEGSLELDDEQERVLRRKTRNSPLTDVHKAKRHKKTSEQTEPESEPDNKSQKRTENRLGHYNTFTIKKINKSVTIDLHSADSTRGYFTLELLEELTTALNKISKEKDCHLVLIRSNQEKVFSLGLDYKSLIFDKEADRKTKATELAEQVGNFVNCLLHFPKILVAGIEGQCVGLAVTILPLFDIVIASDTASFSTPYSSLATIAECAFLLSPPYMPSHGLSGELFYIGQTLTADEVYRKGLITKVCWPEKYQETMKSVIASISKGSKTSLETMKKQITSGILESTEALIESTTKQLVEFWISPESQKNFLKIE
ncbi:HP1 and insulator partner protein 1 isoform X2 [Rhynchophorus ferrugineus]|uniref:HP1 and insulator partner protein 1 isoform X2 n=1 Tax=Rhynchophorus ferrugineus TaxID=354439 RepID=UPI003FCD0770